MTTRTKSFKRGLLMAATFVGILSGVQSYPHAAQAVGNETFPVGEAKQLLAYGFGTITERYLDTVTVERLAVEGIRGLQSFDPALAIDVAGEVVRLRYEAEEVAAFAAPSDNDVDGWAQVAVDLATAARKTSDAVADKTAEELYEAVFDALLGQLDGFSRYSGAAEAKEHRASRNGFGGVGIRYEFVDGFLRIQDVLPETAASTAGLMPGDMIERIDGHSVPMLDEDREEVRRRLRGPINSKLLLSIKRSGTPLEITLRRGLVVPQTVWLENVKDGIAHIRISSFNQRTTRGVTEAVDGAKRKLGREFRGVLLDLRGNPGGLLDQAVAVSDLFLTNGRIVFTRGRHPESLQSYSTRGGDIMDGLPMVVMLDGRSASAAEIVGAALQDSGRAVVVGSSSYGKGTVQTVVRLPNDGEMTLTWSRFHSPSGYALHGLGVMPTVCVSDKSDAADALIKHIEISNTPVTAQFALWRSTPIEDSEGRNDLRSYCPPQNQADWKIDADVGIRLLADHSLYARALSMTAPKSAAAASSETVH